MLLFSYLIFTGAFGLLVGVLLLRDEQARAPAAPG
jgi:hypothetical protein